MWHESLLEQSLQKVFASTASLLYVWADHQEVLTGLSCGTHVIDLLWFDSTFSMVRQYRALHPHAHT